MSESTRYDRPLRLALVTGLSLALADQLRSVVSGHSLLRNADAVFLPAALIAIALILGYGVAWFVLDRCAAWLGRGRSAVPWTAAALTAAPIIWYLFAEFAYPTDPNAGYRIVNSFKRPSIAGFIVVFTLMAGGIVWLATERLEAWTSPWKERLDALVGALPAVVGLALVVGWFRVHGGSGAGFPVLLGLLGLLCAALLIASLPRFGGRVVLRLLASMLAFLIVAGAVGGPARTKSLVHQPRAQDTPAPAPISHVVLITIDTLRADALSPYGAPVERTPAIDAFAKDALVFTQARSASSWSVPSFASILTGVSPVTHGADKYDPRLPEQIPTLAEHFLAAGYRTAAIGDQGWLSEQQGGDGRKPILSGFEIDLIYPKHLPSGLSYRILKRIMTERYRTHLETPDIGGWAIEYVEQNAHEPFFLWTQFFDPHEPLDPPSRFLPDDPEVRRFRDRRKEMQWSPTLEEQAALAAHYHAETSFVDEMLGKLFQTLKEKGLYDDALIILTADHGEELYDHGRIGHNSLHDEVIHIPLIVKLPGSGRTGRLTTPVTNRAVMATLLDLAGITPEDSPIAPSLRPAWEQAATYAEEAQPVFSRGILNGEDREAVIWKGMKYIRFPYSNRAKLYDLEEDPRERINLIGAREAAAVEASALLDAQAAAGLAERQALGIDTVTESTIDAERLEKLRAIGYVE